MTVHTYDATLFDQMLAGNGLIVIDFWAQWCGPCKHFEPVFAKVAEKFPEVDFVKVNIEEQAALAEELNIRPIPHLMIIKEGIAIYSESGSMPESIFMDLVSKAVETSVADIKMALEENEKSKK